MREEKHKLLILSILVHLSIKSFINDYIQINYITI